MKSLIRWAIDNTPAMNTLMLAVLLVGSVSLYSIHREVFPEFDLELIYVAVPYPGASPSEVEEGICQKIEEAIRPIEHVKKLTSVSREGVGYCLLELESSVPDVQRTLNEVRSEVDRIPSFPELAEDPEIKQITLRQAAIRVGVVGPSSDDANAELDLREVAEEVRDDLLHLDLISQAKLIGVKEYQIDVEISEDTLRKYGLSLKDVAQIVRRENVEMPGGSMKTTSQEVLLRGKNKQLVGTEIAKIPLVTQPNGVVLTVGDLGAVRDEFADTTATSRINGSPGMVISVDKTAQEDLLGIVDQVRKYIANKKLPPGYQLEYWMDASIMVRDRLELLARNGLQGLVLVFVILAIFLELRLALWVALGIPISMLGACAVLYWSGQTLNMLSMFAFLMALGILVDDAIVIGENVFSHRQQGKGLREAAIDGTVEVLPSVIASVSTTIIAFVPMLFVPGIMGKFIAVMPLAVISMLVISLLESTFILPCHLAHSGEHRNDEAISLVRAVKRFNRQLPTLLYWTIGLILLLPTLLIAQFVYPLKYVGKLFGWLNQQSSKFLNWLINRWYVPALRMCLNNPAIAISAAVAVLLLALGLIQGGIVPFVSFPKLDSNSIVTTIRYPDGTPAAITEEATARLESTIRRINDRYTERGMPLIKLTHRAVGNVNVSGGFDPSEGTGGSHMGNVGVELVDPKDRDITSNEILAIWRKESGEFPGVEQVNFGASSHGPGGKPIEFTMLASPKNMKVLEGAIEECKRKLGTYPGVLDISDNSHPGKWEFQLTIKDRAKATGVPLADLAETVRASYYGDEVMRLQRGRHEVKLMVRYPKNERKSLANFDEIRVRAGDRAERPLTELADVKVQRGYSAINRLDQLRSITVEADIDEAVANAREVVADLQENFMPQLLESHPGVNVRWEGQQEETAESVGGLIYGLLIALVVMFALLTLEFRSYAQPALIMFIIPFGTIGAVAGHIVLGLDVTLFSLFGMVALTGVVINDSIVLIDLTNKLFRSGVPLRDALMQAGTKRFRPILLTSLTTIGGLSPILTETSFQAQVLIPMATSLCFGLMFTTALILLLVPVFYQIWAKASGAEANNNQVLAKTSK